MTGIIAALYQQSAWPILSDAFADLLDGDAARMLFLADFYNERENDGSYRGNLIDANIAINCADDRLSSDPQEVEKSLLNELNIQKNYYFQKISLSFRNDTDKRSSRKLYEISAYLSHHLDTSSIMVS